MDLSSRNIANPTAMILSSVGLLRHLGLVNSLRIIYYIGIMYEIRDSKLYRFE